MKQLLITLVAVVLGITAMSSYAEDDYKARVGDNSVNVLSDVSKERVISPIFGDKKHNSDVSDEGKKNYSKESC